MCIRDSLYTGQFKLKISEPAQPRLKQGINLNNFEVAGSLHGYKHTIHHKHANMCTQLCLLLCLHLRVPVWLQFSRNMKRKQGHQQQQIAINKMSQKQFQTKRELYLKLKNKRRNCHINEDVNSVSNSATDSCNLYTWCDKIYIVQ